MSITSTLRRLGGPKVVAPSPTSRRPASSVAQPTFRYHGKLYVLGNLAAGDRPTHPRRPGRVAAGRRPRLRGRQPAHRHRARPPVSARGRPPSSGPKRRRRPGPHAPSARPRPRSSTSPAMLGPAGGASWQASCPHLRAARAVLGPRRRRVVVWKPGPSLPEAAAADADGSGWRGERPSTPRRDCPQARLRSGHRAGAVIGSTSSRS